MKNLAHVHPLPGCKVTSAAPGSELTFRSAVGRYTRGLRATVLFILLAALIAQTRPDFSGVWQLNKEKSNADVSTAWMRIQQSASGLTVNIRVMQSGQEETQTMRYTLGPEESSNSMHGAPMKSHAAWDGNTLVITSVAMLELSRCA